MFNDTEGSILVAVVFVIVFTVALVIGGAR